MKDFAFPVCVIAALWFVFWVLNTFHPTHYPDGTRVRGYLGRDGHYQTIPYELKDHKYGHVLDQLDDWD